jgi:NADH dehydrogenase/NADH:ubiquinone oxidoreductase subunit G
MSDQDQPQESAGSGPAIQVDGNQSSPAPQAVTESAPQTSGSAQPQSDQYSNLLNTIVNDEGSPKYRTIEEALVGSSHAQEHIRRLEQENEQLRQGRLQADAVQEIKEALLHNRQEPTSSGGQEDFASIAEQVYERRQQEVAQQSNVQQVNSVMHEKFGDNARTHVEQKAQELGVGVEFLSSLAATSPKAFLAYFDTQPAPGTPSTPSTSQPRQAPVAGQGLEVPSNIMVGASSRQVLDLWRSVGARVQEEINQ